MSFQLAVSNIAFPPLELDRTVELLRQLRVAAVELAPYHVFGRWDVSQEDVNRVRDSLDASGIRCVALQGILYQVGSIHLFESDESRAALHRHLISIARMASRLGARACVFGAPRLRDPGSLDSESAQAIAVDFFRKVGSSFADEGVSLALEPNARHYGCRFIVTTEEAVELVKLIDAPGIGLQIDTGTMFLEGEDPAVLSRAAPYAVHAHVSEPDLAPVGSSGVDHEPIAAALRASGYAGALCIEMKCVDDWGGAVGKAVALTRRTYLDE